MMSVVITKMVPYAYSYEAINLTSRNLFWTHELFCSTPIVMLVAV